MVEINANLKLSEIIKTIYNNWIQNGNNGLRINIININDKVYSLEMSLIPNYNTEV